MKKIAYLSILVFAVLFGQVAQAALSPEKATPAFKHLCEVNKEWNVYQGPIPNDEIQFENDKQRIRFHLLTVINILKEKELPHIDEIQLAKRNTLLDELTLYAVEMNFPKNEVYQHRQPCFIDAYNNFCAVGYMIKVSGYEKVAREIQAHQNYAYLADINHKSIPSWARQHGFDLQELAWIQPTYSPANNYESIGQGTDENVIAMTHYQNKVYFIGDFSEVDGEPCDGVGVYSNGSAECVLNGLEGTLNSVTAWAGKIWVSGAIEHNGSQYTLASFDGTSWQYQNVGSVTGAIGLNVLPVYGSLFYTAIKNGESYEIWLTDGSTWLHKATLNGPVNSSALMDDKAFFGGDFDQVTIHYGGGNTQIFETNNLISVENVGGQWQTEAWTAYTGTVPSVINVLKSEGQVLYIGGADNDANPIVLSRFQNDGFQTMLQSPEFANEYYSLRDISVMPDNSLWLAGDLGASLSNFPSLTFGQHLYKYYPTSGQLEPLALFNSPVNCIANTYSEVVLGGEFVSNVGEPMNHLAKSMTPTGIDQLENEITFSMYPNPVTDILQIDFKESQHGELRVTDLSGRILHAENIMGKNKTTLDLTHLSSQVVFVSIFEQGKSIKTERLVIQ